MSQVNLLDAPDSTQLAALRDWLMDKQGGAHFLKDSEARLWETEDGSSLVRVGNSKGEHDVFTRFTSWFVVSLLHRYSCLPKSTGRVVDVETGMVSYDESKIIRAGTITATVLSSMFPVLSILVLYVVKNTYARIGIAAGFTALFAVFLASFSSARRVEIFAATATWVQQLLIDRGLADTLQVRGCRSCLYWERFESLSLTQAGDALPGVVYSASPIPEAMTQCRRITFTEALTKAF